MNKDELFKKLDNYELKIKELKEKLLNNYKDFDIWYRCSEKEDYQYLIWESSAPVLRKFLNQFEFKRYSIINLDHILALIEDGTDHLTENERNLLRNSIQEELIKNNIGSMIYDW